MCGKTMSSEEVDEMPRKGAKLSPEAAEKQRQAQAAWHKEHCASLGITVRKEDRDRYAALAKSRGMSLRGLIISLLEREAGER